ncbi:hypothetical protein BCY84_01090 [Trypanosoma cruzi cruzi]|uniref:GRAM domain-containing protein n=1 Tax=Trypanosoma cruzi TaxID=5693 RepID=A0A2V2VLS5_TRYCR|nr:hypothetical protein BCY84_01090 [Trypanosoma cruzi cruzi]PWU96666.1 hypothetical protein C4B63_18g264 [Trypanosoma cruzi]
MDKWTGRVQAVSNSVAAVDVSVGDVVKALLAVAEQYAADMSPVEAMGRAIIQGVANASATLVSCLTDLATMSEAMKDAMNANPKEAHSLMMNLFNVFVKQLTVYYKENYEAFKKAEVTLRQQRALFWSQKSEVETNNDNTSDFTLLPEEEPSPFNTSLVAFNTPKEAKKKSTDGKKKKTRDSSKDTSVVLPSEQHSEKQQGKPAKGEGGGKNVCVDAPSTNVTEKNETAQQGNEGDSPSKVKSFSTEPVVTVKEPIYLHVASTVEDALGRLVLSSRPNVFTAPEVIENRAPIATYYIKLPAPGSMGPLLLSNYIALGDDMQADLMCDILQSDCVEVVPFESPAGEIIVEDPSDLHELPACGWRVGSSEDHRQAFYTLYILVTRGEKMTPSLLIQESLLIDSESQEVMHEITAVPDAPQIAKVTVRGFGPAPARSASPTKRYTSDRLLAIVNITKSTYERNGFVEIKKEELRALVRQMHAHELQLLREEELLTRPNSNLTTAAAAFQGTVELASLEQPGEQQGWGLTDVAKGAVRGAAAVVLAPVSVGKVVGNAVLDASGVTGAIKQQKEVLFRKSFPNLSSEEIIETFSCALVDDGNPIPKQGFVFITPRWLCFQAGLLSANFSLEWDEIRDIQKQRTVKVLENAIAIQTHLGGTYFLTSFVQRDQAYADMMKQWLRR